MKTKFGESTPLFIESKLEKMNTSVLALIMFYEKKEGNPKKYIRVLSCPVFSRIKSYVCIAYLPCL